MIDRFLNQEVKQSKIEINLQIRSCYHLELSYIETSNVTDPKTASSKNEITAL